VLKILWVKTGGLVPLDTGGKIRSYHILRELSRRHDVTFFTFYPEHPNDIHGELNQILSRVILHPLRLPCPKSIAGLTHYARRVLSLQPYQVGKYCASQVATALGKLLQQETFDLIVCDFLAPAGIIPWHLPCPKILFAHNVEALIWKRHLEVARNPLWKAICWREYQTTVRAERRYLNLADHVLTVSETDRDIFAKLIEPDKITVIPTGVDIDFFRPAKVEEQPNTLVFTGSMDWIPNEDGIFFFVEKIFPRIRSQIPNVSLRVVGRRPSARLLELARTTDGLQVTGEVEDIRPHVLSGTAYVVPLRVGSGTRLKIFEAMAMGKAVVSTSIGAEGLPVHPGRDILIADNPGEFAGAVVGLLQDRARRSEIGRAARELVAREYSWESVGRCFEAVMATLVRTDSVAHDDNLRPEKASVAR
jgi:sugar transferase (PEP-CTERM/EpsH1 system associated)